MARTFTITGDEPVRIESDAGDMWVMLPAGTVLAVDERERRFLEFSSGGGPQPIEWVDAIVYTDGSTTPLPIEQGSVGDGEPDDLRGLTLMTADEAKRKHPEFSWLFEDADEEDEDEDEDEA